MESKSREQLLREQSLRNEFEVWAKGKGHSTDRDILGRYVFSYTSTAWEGWQASRTALVVELPESFEVEMGSYGDAKAVSVAEVIESIRAAGITVKGEGDE
ncbi:hypothetical protein RJE46_14145 [Cedecea neteri]|uniref:hypothetical protein n=1 Tax=Cedecea neteri TaxID=158822 RepID=UPI0028930600|nr:hypothetical protein [Cedecea neteri]WNJ77773.1 hypothetical protein RJE46_14145 [Cedecea neteri]